MATPETEKRASAILHSSKGIKRLDPEYDKTLREHAAEKGYPLTFVVRDALTEYAKKLQKIKKET